MLFEGSAILKVRGDRFAKRVYVGKCMGSHLVGQQQERWIDFVIDCLKKMFES